MRPRFHFVGLILTETANWSEPPEGPRHLARYCGLAATEEKSPRPLGQRKEMPFPVNGLELVNSAFIRVQEIISVGNPMRARRTNRALCPFRPRRRRGRPSVLPQNNRDLHSELDPVFDAGWPRWHQSSFALPLFRAHKLFPQYFPGRP